MELVVSKSLLVSVVEDGSSSTTHTHRNFQLESVQCRSLARCPPWVMTKLPRDCARRLRTRCIGKIPNAQERYWAELRLPIITSSSLLNTDTERYSLTELISGADPTKEDLPYFGVQRLALNSLVLGTIQSIFLYAAGLSFHQYRNPVTGAKLAAGPLCAAGCDVPRAQDSPPSRRCSNPIGPERPGTQRRGVAKRRGFIQRCTHTGWCYTLQAQWNAVNLPKG